jgi:hypothetical protein
MNFSTNTAHTVAMALLTGCVLSISAAVSACGPVTWILILPGNPAVATSPRTGGHRIRNPRQVPDGRHLHQP